MGSYNEEHVGLMFLCSLFSSELSSVVSSPFMIMTCAYLY